ncbi:MAG: hypothetical protein JWL64_1700, partial [Frankiales bacterium]|nr:hypothetical protein [Frankiales bacterium]
AAELSLARTPDLLPVLRQAGVVDAGGQGLVVLLLALEEIVLQRRGCDGASGERPARARPVPVSGAQPSHEVQFLLHGADQAAVAVLRDRLGVLGDSVLIAGEAGLHHVHVHTDDVRAVVAAGSASGRPAAVRVTHLIDGTTTDPLIRDRIVVAVVSGEGLSALFARAGARVLHGGPLARPTQDELLEALLEPGVREVVLLPNDEGGLRTARAAAAEAATAGVCVAVVASTSAVQGLAALAVADPGRSWEDTVRDMSAAVDATRCAQVVLARGSAITAAGTCLPGDALGVVAGEVVLVGADVDWVARQMLDRLAPDAELVTVVLGAGAGADTGELLAAHAARRHPGVVVTVLSGGQPHCAVLLGAE